MYAYVFNSPTNFTDPTGELAAQAIACGIGGGISIGNDLLSGRKINWGEAGLGCLAGAVGLRGAAELPRLAPKFFHILNHNRYFRIGEGRFGNQRVYRVSVGSQKGGFHSRLWP